MQARQLQICIIVQFKRPWHYDHGIYMYTLFHTTKSLINTNLSDDNYKADGQLEKFEESKKIYRQKSNASRSEKHKKGSQNVRITRRNKLSTNNLQSSLRHFFLFRFSYVTLNILVLRDCDVIYWFLLHHIDFVHCKWCVTSVFGPVYENFNLFICFSSFITNIKWIEIGVREGITRK